VSSRRLFDALNSRPEDESFASLLFGFVCYVLAFALGIAWAFAIVILCAATVLRRMAALVLDLSLDLYPPRAALMAADLAHRRPVRRCARMDRVEHRCSLDRRVDEHVVNL
jgi:hypothetical protein